MRLWGVYSDSHTEIDVVGDREGLHAFAQAAKAGDHLELVLDEPPPDQTGRPLDAITFAPANTRDTRICFSRSGSTLVVTGSPPQLGRIVGGATADLAEGPAQANSGVPRHLHLDPTSDPERDVYSPMSCPLTVVFDAPE